MCPEMTVTDMSSEGILCTSVEGGIDDLLPGESWEGLI